MAEANPKVKIDIDVDDANLGRRLNKIKRQFERLDRTVTRMDRRGSGVNDRFKKLDDRLGRLGRTLSGVLRGFGRLFSMFAKFSFLAMAGELAIFTAGLLAIKLAMMTGRAAARMYDVALQGISVAAATAATALATAAAAMRQFQEAQLSPFLGNQPGGAGGLTGLGRRDAAGRLGRGFGTQMQGLLGGEASQQIAGSFARAGIGGVTASTLNRSLFDMSAGDAKAMMQVISELGPSGSLAGAMQAVKALPGFKKGASMNVSGIGGLMGLITSGALTSSSFQGFGNMLGGTFIGSAKTSFAGVKNTFADAGMALLKPMQETMLQMTQILKENMLSLQMIIHRFGADSMGPTMVTVFDRMMRFITENVIDHLANIKEMGEGFMGFFRAIRNFFTGMGDFLGRYEPAANVIIDMFKAASNANKSSLFRDFSRGLVANADRIKEFGAGLGRFFGGIFSLFEGGNNAFFGGLEKIVKVMDTITDDFIPALSEFFSAAAPIVAKLPTIIESLSTVMSTIAPVLRMVAEVVGRAIGIVGGGGTIGQLLLGGMVGKKVLNSRMLRRGMARMGMTGGGAAAGSAMSRMFGLAPGAAGAAGAGMTGQRLFYGLTSSSYSKYMPKPMMDFIIRSAGYTGPHTVIRPHMVGASPFGAVAIPRAPLHVPASFNPTNGFGRMLASTATMRNMASNFAFQRALPAAGLLAVPDAIDFFKPFGNSALKSGTTGLGDMMSLAVTGSGIGGAIGSFIAPGPGTLIGMGIGAGVGFVTDPLIAGFMKLTGMDSFQERHTKKHIKSFNELRARNKELSGVNAINPEGRGLFNQTGEALALFMDAVTAADRTKDGGDTEAFKKFLRFIGEDPNKHNLDDRFDEYVRTGYASEQQTNMMNMQIRETNRLGQSMRGAQLAIDAFETSIVISTDMVEDFYKSLGLDGMAISPMQAMAAGAVLAAQQLILDRNKGYLPDLLTSGLSRTEARLTAEAQYNAIASGDLSIATINDFISSKALFETSKGVRPDIAGISGLFDLQEGIKFGHFAGNEGAIQNIVDTGFESLATQYAEAGYGTREEMLGLMRTGNFTQIDKMIEGRNLKRRAIGGDPTLSLSKRVGALQGMGVNFDSAFYTSFAKFLPEGSRFQMPPDAAFRANLTPDQIIKGMAGSGASQEEVATAVTKALIDTGFNAGDTGVKLDLIYDALGALPGQMQKWTLILNDGTVTGGDTEIAVEGPDVPPSILNISEVTEEKTGEVIQSIFGTELIDRLVNDDS